MRTGCTVFGWMRTALAILGIGLLVACSSSDGGSSTSESSTSDANATTDDTSGSMVADLGAWNSLTPGSLDISDANSVLRAYYDASGTGHLDADSPVQPQGTGSATWGGMWSGKIDVSPGGEADAGLASLGLTRADLAALGGPASITAYFGSAGGVQAELTYSDTGLEELELASITSNRVAVNGGTFDIARTLSKTLPPVDFAGRTLDITVRGAFSGEGAFGGTDAEGVAGYLDGDITFSYLGRESDLGPFTSVFYGTKDSN